MNHSASLAQAKAEVRDCLRSLEERLGEKSREGAEAVYYANPVDDEDEEAERADLLRQQNKRFLNLRSNSKASKASSVDLENSKALKPRGRVYVQVVDKQPAHIDKKSKEKHKKQQADYDIGLRFDQYQYEKERNLERLRAEIHHQETAPIFNSTTVVAKNRKPLYRDPLNIQLEKSQKYSQKHSTSEGLTFAPNLSKSKEFSAKPAKPVEKASSPKKEKKKNPISKARKASRSRSASPKKPASVTKEQRIEQLLSTGHPDHAQSKKRETQTQQPKPKTLQISPAKPVASTSKEPHYARPTKDSQKKSELSQMERSLSREKRRRTQEKETYSSSQQASTKELFLKTQQQNLDRIGRKVAQLIYRDQL